MKFILLMFTRSHKKHKTAGSGTCFKSLSEAPEGHPQSQFDPWWQICWSSFLCNCNAFGNLEEIHLAKGNRTDMRYPYSKAFPIPINPEMCPTLLSKVSLNSSLSSPQLCLWGLGSRLSSCPSYKLSEEWPSSHGLKGDQQSCCLNETYDPHCQSIHFASSVKKETGCTGSLTAVAGC